MATWKFDALYLTTQSTDRTVRCWSDGKYLQNTWKLEGAH